MPAGLRSGISNRRKLTELGCIKLSSQGPSRLLEGRLLSAPGNPCGAFEAATRFHYALPNGAKPVSRRGIRLELPAEGAGRNPSQGAGAHRLHRPNPSEDIAPLTFASLDPETEPANSGPMDALLLGPAIAFSFTLSLLAGKLVLHLFMTRILGQRN